LIQSIKLYGDQAILINFEQKIDPAINAAVIALKKPQKEARQLKIPVCYELPYALDLQALSDEKGISLEKIIELHTSQTYKVYMLGFLPGFTFMGKIVPALACKRKLSPRLKVPASSVGIAGFQTGIYPTTSPGGWQILGRTPLKIFDPKKENPFLFQAGDEVTFYPITSKEFLRIEKKETNEINQF